MARQLPGEAWRWNVMRHPRPSAVTIVVPEPSEKAVEEREKKIREGADVVPFGFGRAIEQDGNHVENDVVFEPLLWDGDNG